MMAFLSKPMLSMPDTGILDSASPLSKRRKFMPPSAFGIPSLIPSADNANIENHTFSTPILPQLSSQAPTPDEIEAELLHVGMRVRKSVSEGYKKKSFTPRPFANNLSRLSPETQKALLTGNATETKAPEPYHAGGMHNTGGLAMQPLATATFCGINLAALSWSGDDWSSPSVAEQSLWSYSTSHKRNYEADSDSDESQDWQPQTPTLMPDHGFGMEMPIDYFHIGCDDAMSDVSPMTQLGERHSRRRKLAKPRTRVQRPQITGFQTMEMQMPPTLAMNPFASINVEVMQQPQQESMLHQEQSQAQYSLPDHVPMGHKRMLSCGMEATMDFGDAAFLQRREDVEMDCS